MLRAHMNLLGTLRTYRVFKQQDEDFVESYLWPLCIKMLKIKFPEFLRLVSLWPRLQFWIFMPHVGSAQHQSCTLAVQLRSEFSWIKIKKTKVKLKRCQDSTFTKKFMFQSISNQRILDKKLKLNLDVF